MAAPIVCGFIIRRDNPNGERYARQNRAGKDGSGVGFDNAPLPARAEEFDAWATGMPTEKCSMKPAREAGLGSIQAPGKRSVCSYWASSLLSSPSHRRRSIAISRRFGLRANPRPNGSSSPIKKET
ncbi:helix-turn-helix domain-containing protein [uncultured Rhodoblastus sp.]|uniref:helix-turn-helix domain-containing protein n=1 Tax=uncultured Rhodoblastus sp. TaxID=543037 RepID=UPI0025DC38A8|nr:helix-turn-helix domain-containing protein [uncultured Rhodoblastus sp.]